MKIIWSNRLSLSKRNLSSLVCFALVAASVSVGPAVAQRGQADVVVNPLAGDQSAVPTGKVLFQQTCESCHGAGATGDRGPALNTGTFRHGGTDADLFHTIQTGVPGTQMPSFSGLPADTVWQIIAYLRSLSGKTAAQDEVVPGDVAAGEKLYWGKAGCGSCHEVNGRGGIVASDLSAAGTSAASFLHNAIVKPTVGPYGVGAAVLVKTRDGKQVRGVRRAEDTYTLILADQDGNLHQFDKGDLLDEQVLPESLMPANYGQTLSHDEIQNLVAYLKSLKARDFSKTIEADLPAGLSFERLRNANAEPQNWLTYWGDYQGHHNSALGQITPDNVKQLQAKWSIPMQGPSILEATPLVVDGIMYTSGQPGQVFAIDAKSGLVIWKYERKQKVVNPYQTNSFNRGVAMLGDRLFLGTLDAALISLDARTGRVLWETQVADTMQGYTITQAPLAIQGKIIVGVAGGEFGIRGFVDAYDAVTGKRLWRFYTTPGPGEFGHDTWKGDSWQHGGAPTWLTGSYDPQLNLLYWAVGNPGPDLNGDVREGDDLFSCSVLALDPSTGKLKWYYQFSPGDTHDWDSTEDMVLVDRTENGTVKHLLLHADRNGMYYVLDRTNGKFLFAKPYIKETWNSGFDKNGRPIDVPGTRSSPEGSVVFPALGGGTNWQSPSYDPARSTLYVAAHDGGVDYHSAPVDYDPGRQYMGGGSKRIDAPTDSVILAIDTTNGNVKWKFPVSRLSLGSGVLATSSGLLFVSSADGDLSALDQQSGKSLWHFQTGAPSISSSPMSYSVDGKQFIAVSAGSMLYSFALPD